MIGLYLALTFGVTWVLWLLPDMVGASRTGMLALGGPVFLVGVFAPGLVAVAMTGLAEGREGVARLLGRILRWRVPWHLYAFALLYMTVTKLTAAAVVRASTGAWPAFGAAPWPLLVVVSVIATWGQAGEELGWRGYVLPRLATRIGPALASVLLGVIWALWHLPLFFIPGTGSDGQSFPMYLLHVTAMSVAFGWLYWRTGGSLLLTMLMHAAVNNTGPIVPAALVGATDPFSWRAAPIAWATVAIAWLVAAWCLTRMPSAGVWGHPGRLRPQPR